MIYINKEAEILIFLQKNGIIDLPKIEETIKMNERQKYLDKHPYKIWQSTDGRWYTNVPDKTKPHGMRNIKKGTKEKLEEAIINFWKDQEENPTIEELFNEWVDNRILLKKISPSTHKRYSEVFRRFFKEEIDSKRIKELTIENWVDFLEKQIPKYNLTAKDFSNLKTVVKGIVKLSRKKRYINYTVEDVFAELDVSDKSFKKVIKEDYQEVYDENETEIIVRYLIDNPEIRNLAILLMFVTGLRVGELVALKKSDFYNNTITVRRTESKLFIEKGKYEYIIKEFPKSEAGVRTVVIPIEYQWLIDKLTSTDNEYIFHENGKRFTTNVIRRRLRNICDKLHIYRKSPHKVRKTYGTILLDNNIDNKFIMGQMGHTDISCTEKHYHRNRRSYEKKTEIINAIPDFHIKPTEIS